MSGLIKNLLKRTTNESPVVYPRLLSKYESSQVKSNDIKVDDVPKDQGQGTQFVQTSNKKSKKMVTSESESNHENFQSKVITHDDASKDTNRQDGVNNNVKNRDTRNQENMGSVLSEEIISKKEPEKLLQELVLKNDTVNDFPSLMSSSKIINQTIKPRDKYIDHKASIPPAIKVSIGRIEVKATVEKPKVNQKRKPLNKPKMSLEEYLHKQKKIS